MKKLKSKHAATEKRTSDIIKAALECFTELGFDETSMSDICSRSNASIGSIYHHFKSKEQLSSAVYLEGIGIYQSGMLKSLKKEDDAFSGVSSIIKYHIKWIEKNPEWAQFLFRKKIHFSYSGETEESLQVLNKEFISGISDWFKIRITAGKIRPLPWDILTSLLLGPCEEFSRLYLSKKTVTKTDDAIREISLAVWRSLSNEK